MLLKIENLCVDFCSREKGESTVRAVDRVSLDLDRGHVLCVVGESGCGKSAMSMSIPRLLPSPPARIASGRILFDGENLLDASPSRMRQLRGKHIGVVFQDPMTSLSPLHRIGRQIEEVLELHGGIGAKERRALSLEWLAKVGIPEPAAKAQAYPHELSGGMQQRVMIAMALILKPDLIIADEPTTALDVTLQMQILDLMRSLISSKSAMLLITHDMGVVYRMATDIAVMYAGQVVERRSDAAAFFADPRHPYSKALLESMPSAATSGKRLPAIPGQVPSAGNFPSGCRFAPRCALARPDCAEVSPELRGVAGNLARCPYI